MPEAVRDRLKDLCISRHDPAFFLCDASGTVRLHGGNWARYGVPGLAPGANAGDVMDVLAGLLPLGGTSVVIPFVQVPNVAGCYIDMHLFPSRDGDWVLVLDSTEEASRLQELQQAANSLALMRREQDRIMDRLRRHADELTSMLDHMDLITAIVDASGRIEFLSQAGRRFLGLVSDATGQPWQDVFGFPAADAARVEALLKQPAATRQRLRLQTRVAGGRPCCIDLDAEDAPHDPLKRILHVEDRSEVFDLRRMLHEQNRFRDIVGKAEPMRRVFQLIQDVARVDATVLIQGETGTGKELAARAIHDCSPRKDGPFVVVNCAGLSDSLINSQLFGHRKGAFTDAIRDQEGVFEAAHGGTILLDEIGDIPMNTQTRLLRVLEQREVVRIGETQPRKVDIRVLAATNRDLGKEVAAGRFRSDLLYRIRIARVHLPPLRERREDIPVLVEAFLAQSRAASGKPVNGVETEAMRRLMDYDWPGNVRELRNAVEFAVIRMQGDRIRLADLPPELLSPKMTLFSRRPYETEDEKQRILDALARSKGRRGEAAKLLGISRATLYRRMKACFIDPEDVPTRGKWFVGDT
jgi:transcriptional regulator with PAS, ATPase and Fis domain